MFSTTGSYIQETRVLGDSWEEKFISAQVKITSHRYGGTAVGAWADDHVVCSVKAERKDSDVNAQCLRWRRISLLLEWTHPQSVILSISVKPGDFLFPKVSLYPVELKINTNNYTITPREVWSVHLVGMMGLWKNVCNFKYVLKDNRLSVIDLGEFIQELSELVLKIYENKLQGKILSNIK